jgi:NAD-dependent DNA ligase
MSGASAAPAWSTATYPATTTANQLLYSSATNTVTGLATAGTLKQLDPKLVAQRPIRAVFYAVGAVKRIAQQLALARERSPGAGLDLSAMNVANPQPLFRKKEL